MLLLIVQSSFPKSSTPQAAKAFTMLPKLPATVKRQGPYFHFDETDTICSLTLYSFGGDEIGTEEKKFVKKRMKTFAGVPGFQYSIKDWLTMKKAVALLSTATPAQ